MDCFLRCRIEKYSTPPLSSVNVGKQELMICHASGIVVFLKKAGLQARSCGVACLKSSMPAGNVRYQATDLKNNQQDGYNALRTRYYDQKHKPLQEILTIFRTAEARGSFTDCPGSG